MSPKLIVVLLGALALRQPTATPTCAAEQDRRAERLHGDAKRGAAFEQTTPSGWIVRLRPGAEGWLLEIAMKGREAEDLARLTPPWHGVPNPRQLEGWHFRNASNTGPNDGTVNAPQELREFIFSPQVGRDVDYHGSSTGPEDVAKVRAFGRGWLSIQRYTLTPPRRGERAAFETLAFDACLTWPASK